MDRLPLEHPDYRYTESRNPYWLKLRQESRQVFPDNASELHRGQWREQFPHGRKSSPLHVEIGCNAGHVVLEWAARDPKGCYIGVDWKFKMIHKAADKAGKRKIDNLLFLRAHADRLKYMFA
ncbi:MAG TPA: hypothetical protein VM598_10730, partial [Bdellovibrionota bacterium]|nr:hypothetical protein [Bdellovibrionota bacterium]